MSQSVCLSHLGAATAGLSCLPLETRQAMVAASSQRMLIGISIKPVPKKGNLAAYSFNMMETV